MSKVLNPEATPWSPMSSILPHNRYYLHQLPFSNAATADAIPAPPAFAYPAQPFPPPYMQPPYQAIQFYNHPVIGVYDMYSNWSTVPNLDVIDHSQEHQEMATSYPLDERRGGCVSFRPPRLRKLAHKKEYVSPPPAATIIWKNKVKDNNELKHKDNNNEEEVLVQAEDESGSSTVTGHKKKTSVMIRNIPNQFRREELLQFLDFYCVRQKLEYDFFYLPMDFRSRNNFGYAFVNFTTSSGASKIMSLLDGHKWRASHSQLHSEKSKKICQVNWARIQGKEELIKNFQRSKFLCDENEYLPVVFSPPRNGSTCLSNPFTIGNLRSTQHRRLRA